MISYAKFNGKVSSNCKLIVRLVSMYQLHRKGTPFHFPFIKTRCPFNTLPT